MLSNRAFNYLVKASNYLQDYVGKTYKFKKYGKCIIAHYTLIGQLCLENAKGEYFSVWFDEVKEELK